MNLSLTPTQIAEVLHETLRAGDELYKVPHIPSWLAAQDYWRIGLIETVEAILVDPNIHPVALFELMSKNNLTSSRKWDSISTKERCGVYIARAMVRNLALQLVTKGD